MRPADLPILAVGGSHDAGKTTLLEALVPMVAARGLAVAIVKSAGSRIEVDCPGKDSDRLFRAGADVFVRGKAEGFVRTRPAEEDRTASDLAALARLYDLVLLECRSPMPCATVWLLGEGESEPPAEAADVLAALPRGPERAETVYGILGRWLPEQWLRTPVYGCILIGGRSSRMGAPKHLLRSAGRTWIERIVEVLRPAVEHIVIAGTGDVPDALAGVTRLPDVPDAEGPMAGILAAMRWAPWATWLVAACDLPNLSAEALEWLLATRAAGVWATVPLLAGARGVEPLLAHYDFRAGAILERLAAAGRFAPSRAAEHPKVAALAPPSHLAPAWDNVNTPGDLPRGEGGE
jgi:molybdopterin-guanine dinucleotide biosynthesis protein MobB